MSHPCQISDSTTAVFVLGTKSEEQQSFSTAFKQFVIFELFLHETHVLDRGEVAI